MAENKSTSSTGIPSFNDHEWRGFKILPISAAANAIGAGLCIFYFYNFEPTGNFPDLYDAFLIPVVVTISLIMIGMLYQYRWKKSLIAYIHILHQGLDAPSELKNNAQRQILNLIDKV